MTRQFNMGAGPAELTQKAETAQQRGDWTRASVLWREVAQACEDEEARARYLQLAAWCDDMREIIREGSTP